MKARRFYPKQVINKLKSKSVDSYGQGEKAALEFFYRKSRRYGWSLMVINNASYDNPESFRNNPVRITVIKG